MTSTPLEAVRHYIDSFNAGDVDAMAAAFDVSGSILDGMPPHLWHGPDAAREWYRDVLAEANEHGATDYFVTLFEPLQNTVTGDAAYVAVPAAMTFNLRGERITQSGATMTLALRHGSDRWRIAAWAWTKGRQ
ncbi:nuclear transport factor 2 family protein [Mycolicibacterium sp. P1-5]|uniref:YybH family protein n=1 Tax=Mycolicibacterium sp. P1-5 TaxID=2024617 RepID=UPI0011ED9645|nr:nuclear transport factor 2 family protein [Mycolicibacterium sp. P1-5]KAA0108683.1 hypothetical protein CIW47_14060 [Mycolicibacterium sp. P1-5]